MGDYALEAHHRDLEDRVSRLAGFLGDEETGRTLQRVSIFRVSRDGPLQRVGWQAGRLTLRPVTPSPEPDEP